MEGIMQLLWMSLVASNICNGNKLSDVQWIFYTLGCWGLPKVIKLLNKMIDEVE